MLQELERRMSATISGWDCPLPTFIYPAFDSGMFLAKEKVREHRGENNTSQVVAQKATNVVLRKKKRGTQDLEKDGTFLQETTCRDPDASNGSNDA